MTYCTASMIGAGGLKRVPTEAIENFSVALPEISEQCQITRFLDHETAKIDTLIEQQQRLIELLKEKRQAVISHAVTKGLDPNVPMKDSGVEWLGEVPAHWDYVQLRRIVISIKTGGTPSKGFPEQGLIDGLDWYTPGDFGETLLLGDSQKQVTRATVVDEEVKIFPENSVYVVSIGATLGKVGFCHRPASANQQINVVIPDSKVSGYFLAYSLSVKSDEMRYLSNASTIGIMNQEKTKEIWVAVPPISEQEKIASYLDLSVSDIDKLINEAFCGIALFRERRSALISAAVTGKIDVRNWQPPASASQQGQQQERAHG